MAASTGSPASRRSTKLTPLTTRPAVTSRHGMIRRVRPEASAERVSDNAGALQRGGEVERSFVEGASQDDTLDPLVLDREQLVDVVEAGDAAGGIDRHVDRLRQLDRGLDVHAGEHAVAADVGVDDAFDAVAFELAGKVGDVVLGELAP